MKKLTRKTLSHLSGRSSKKLSALSIFILSPLFMLAQLGGIWYGRLENDSTHKIQDFELGLSEYRGKIMGYTYTTFIQNDTFYYSVKKVIAEKKDGLLIITDDEMISNNFPQRAAKGVKQTTVFPLINDSTFDITKGSWSTNQTKRYYSLKGSAQVQEQQYRDQSDLIAHLEEAKVKNDLVVKKPQAKTEEPIVKTKPEEKKPATVKTQNSAALVKKEQQENNSQQQVVSQPANTVNTKSETKPVTQPEKKNPEPNTAIDHPATTNIPVVTKQTTAAAATQKPGSQQNSNTGSLNNPVKSPANDPPTPVTRTATQQPVNNPVASNKPINKPITNDPPVTKQNSANQNPPVQKTEQPLVSNNKMEDQKIIAAAPTKKTDLAPKILPEDVATRKNETIQKLYFHSDSLVLSLYDNGIVDGDTVTVFLNGNPIISKQQLKVSAFKKTIYITPDMDSVQLVLFADNLGSIPPNTGLLTVSDGNQTYNVRFSADLKKNAAIVLTRKKDQ